MFFRITIAAIVTALTTSGCATITRGSSSDVSFISNPPGALVETSLGSSCTTPCEMKFSRRDTFDATFTLNGEQHTVFVDTVVAGEGAAATGFGNILAGGVIGVGIDVATGAGLNHSPNPVNVVFSNVAEQAATGEEAPRNELAQQSRSGSAQPQLAASPQDPATAVQTTEPADDRTQHYGGITTPGLIEESSEWERTCKPFCT
ncbi:MAG: translation initiation factor 2 [Pseudomonadota bacterium]